MLWITGLLVSILLVFLWVRSFRVDDEALIIISYNSRIALESSLGSISFSVAWNQPSPIALSSGFESWTQHANNFSPLGSFGLDTFKGGGIRIAFPHWLLVVITLTGPGWLLIRRNFSFANREDAS